MSPVLCTTTDRKTKWSQTRQSTPKIREKHLSLLKKFHCHSAPRPHQLVNTKKKFLPS